uniref:histidine kinase n=1 Tax=Anaerolinea thermolimosa TaxID=229919 RepID=A0A7C4KIY7_9CHLR
MKINTLRTRLVLSHLLPLLVIVPLIGIGLIYALETQVLLPGFLRAYLGSAALVAEITQDQYQIWTDPIYAQTILARVSPRLPARVMFISASGRLMASSDPNDLENLTKFIVNPALDVAQDGKVYWRIFYNRQLQGEALDIWEPVLDNRLGQVIGIVRITYSFTSLIEQFVQLRILIAVVLLVGLVMGATLGLSLAVSIARPLRKVTDAVNKLVQGDRSMALQKSRIVELRSLEEAVNALVDRLRSMEEARRHLLANLVHELGRPLGALRSAVQAMLKGAAQDPQLATELLHGMDDELVRLQRLLADLTQLYDQVMGSLELALQHLSLQEWLPEMLAPWQAVAGEKNIHFRVTIPPNLPEVQADPIRLGQAVGNLLSNALKFTPAGKAVEVSAGFDRSEVWIRVKDEGPGIAEEEQEKIFTPFYRGHQGKRFTEGMGLGLSIARDLLLAHGGRLILEESGASGSQFALFLPVASEKK